MVFWSFLWFISDQDESRWVPSCWYMLILWYCPIFIDDDWLTLGHWPPNIWGATPMLSDHTIQMFHPNLPLLRFTNLQKGPNWLKVTHLPGAASELLKVYQNGALKSVIPHVEPWFFNTRSYKSWSQSSDLDDLGYPAWLRKPPYQHRLPLAQLPLFQNPPTKLSLGTPNHQPLDQLITHPAAAKGAMFTKCTEIDPVSNQAGPKASADGRKKGDFRTKCCFCCRKPMAFYHASNVFRLWEKTWDKLGTDTLKNTKSENNV